MDRRPKLKEEALLDKVEEGLEANEVHMSPTGRFRESPDFSIRHRYLTTALELRRAIRSRDMPDALPAINLGLFISQCREARGLPPLEA